MSVEDARDTVRRLGEKWARLALLDRRRAEIDTEADRLRAEIAAMGPHVATAAAILSTTGTP